MTQKPEHRPGLPRFASDESDIVRFDTENGPRHTPVEPVDEGDFDDIDDDTVWDTAPRSDINDDPFFSGRIRRRNTENDLIERTPDGSKYPSQRRHELAFGRKVPKKFDITKDWPPPGESWPPPED